MYQHRSNIICSIFFDGSAEASFRSTESKKRTMRAHVFGEKTQVQHVAADTMHTEEWWEMPKRLKLYDGIHLNIHRLVLREELSQSGDSQSSR